MCNFADWRWRHWRILKLITGSTSHLNFMLLLDCLACQYDDNWTCTINFTVTLVLGLKSPCYLMWDCCCWTWIDNSLFPWSLIFKKEENDNWQLCIVMLLLISYITKVWKPFSNILQGWFSKLIVIWLIQDTDEDWNVSDEDWFAWDYDMLQWYRNAKANLKREYYCIFWSTLDRVCEEHRIIISNKNWRR